MICGQKWVEILIIPSFWLKVDDVTVSLSFIALSRIYVLQTQLDTILIYAKICKDWMSSSWLEK